MSSSDAVTMSSREIAELTGKRHPDVKRDIQRMMDELGEDASIYAHTYLDSQNRQQVEYRLDREHVECLLTGYSAMLRMKVIKRLKELEASTSQPKELSRLELLQIALAAEQEKIKIAAERDHAIATKAQIGSKREATAMAKASAAVREVNRLKDELGCNARHATIIAVERATGSKLPRNAYVSLRRWCRDNGVEPTSVVDPRYGSVKAWPAAAWMATHGIDLSSFFKGEGVAA